MLRRILILLASVAAVGCRSGKEEPGKAGTVPIRRPALKQSTSLDTFAEPGETAPLTDLAAEAGSYHLLALSRPARKVGALHLLTGRWSWKHTVSQQPVLLATHPVTGEGYLIWAADNEAGLTRFRTATGDALRTVSLGPLRAEELQGVAIDPDRNRIYIAAGQGIVSVDLTSNRLLGTIPCERPTGLALDPSLGLAVIPHAAGGISLLDVAAGSLSTVLPAAEGQSIPPGAVAVDPERHHAYVAMGQALADIDLEERKMAGWIAFDPVRSFHAARLAIAPGCGKIYVGCDVLAEVDLETGAWEGIAELGQCPAPLAPAPSLGAVFAASGEQIHSSYHRCGPGEGP